MVKSTLPMPSRNDTRLTHRGIVVPTFLPLQPSPAGSQYRHHLHNGRAELHCVSSVCGCAHHNLRRLLARDATSAAARPANRSAISLRHGRLQPIN
eukprot:1141660-Amphidinium_carterae.2